MKLKHAKKNSGFTLVELLVVIAIIAALAAISSPIIIRQIARARATTAINNGKDIYGALRTYAFKNGGKTPDGTAAAESNIVLRLLFSSGNCQDEKPFFVPGVGDTFVEGDGNYAAAEALAAGENVFSYYVDALARTNITNDPANTPLLGVPCVAAGNIYTGTWLVPAFGGQAVVVRTDGSAIAYGLQVGAVQTIGTATDEAGAALVAEVAPGDDFTSYVSVLPLVL